MKPALLVLGVLLGTGVLADSPVLGNAYTVSVPGAKQSYKAILAPGMQSSFFTRMPRGFGDNVQVCSKTYKVSAVLDDDKERASYAVDLFLGADVLKDCIVKVQPFQRKLTLISRANILKETNSMVLLEPPSGDLDQTVEVFNISAMKGFSMFYAMELSLCGEDVDDMEPLTNNLALRTGKQIVHRIYQRDIAFAGFADNHFQTLVYDFRTGALYGTDPVPSYVSTFFSVVRQPLEFKGGKLYLKGKANSAIKEIEGLPLSIFCELLKKDTLIEVIKRGFLEAVTEDERPLKIQIKPVYGWLRNDPASEDEAKSTLLKGRSHDRRPGSRSDEG